MPTFQLADIQAALQCISSNSPQTQKNEALHFLEQFQKSPEAWSLCHTVLSNTDSQLNELQIFAAQTLRNKVTYDLSQLEAESNNNDNNANSPLQQLKDSIFDLLVLHSQKVVIIQLNVALARLAIQYLEWKNPIPEIISRLKQYPGILLSFLRVLPEETADIGTYPLTEDEYNSRTNELIDSIAEDVLSFLVNCTEIIKAGSNSTVSNSIGGGGSGGSGGNFQTTLDLEMVLRCLASWSFEFSIDQLLSATPLVSLVFESLATHSDDSHVFEAGVDCLCSIIKESRDIQDEQLVAVLYEQLMTLQSTLLPSLQSSDKQEFEQETDPEVLEGVTCLFVEAGEAWCTLICKSPQLFRSMVTVLLLLTCKNSDLDIVSYTFPFWFNLKQFLVLERYYESRKYYTDIFIELINGIISHLQYPLNQFSSKESEDKFKEFRYHMGDVLKDCTAVVGTENALTQPINRINQALSLGTNAIQWQTLEAPLFSLRTMAQAISLTEKVLLPGVFKTLCELPEIHHKIRYATTLVFGRYTEWTARHPECLEMQLRYIFDGFDKVRTSGTLENDESLQDIVTASCHALMYFCSDCNKLLSGYLDQLSTFYFNIQDMLSQDMESQFELCQGLSAVINDQPSETVAASLDKFVEDNLVRIQNLITNQNFSSTFGESHFSNAVADRIDLFYALFEELRPRNEYPEGDYNDIQAEPLLPEIIKIWNALRTLLENRNILEDTVIVERICKFLRRLFEKFHVYCEPIVGDVAELLVESYVKTGYGSFLWCSGSIIVIFGDDDAYPVQPQLKENIWQFAVSLCQNFFSGFNKITDANASGSDGVNANQRANYYEIVTDFFVMVNDMVMFFPEHFIMTTELLTSVVDVALWSIEKLSNYEAYGYVIHCLDDIISWGFRSPPISTVALEFVPDEWRQNIMNEVLLRSGPRILLVLFNGLVNKFEMNSASYSDAINIIIKCLRILLEMNNNDTSVISQWLNELVIQFDGSVTDKERTNLVVSVVNGLKNREYRKVRESVRTFVEWYTRKHISSRI